MTLFLQKQILCTKSKHLWGGVRQSNVAVHMENYFPIKYNARDSERERASEFWVRKLLFRSFSGPACVASLAAGGFAQRWRLLRRAAVVGFGFVGVAAVYKAQIPRDSTCSAVLHTGTTGSHGERRL